MHLSEICNIKKNKHKIKDVPAAWGLKFSKAQKKFRKNQVAEVLLIFNYSWFKYELGIKIVPKKSDRLRSPNWHYPICTSPRAKISKLP